MVIFKTDDGHIWRIAATKDKREALVAWLKSMPHVVSVKEV